MSSLATFFNPSQLTKLRDVSIEAYYQVFKDQLHELLGLYADTKQYPELVKKKKSREDRNNSRGQSTDEKEPVPVLKVAMKDVHMLSLRAVLLDAIQDSESGFSDQEIKMLALRLLAIIGVRNRNPETLLMVSYWQKELGVDVTHELDHLLKEDERFLKPEKEIKYETSGPR